MNGENRVPHPAGGLRRWGMAALALVPLMLGGATGAWAKSPGWLGVSMQELTPTLRDGMNVKVKGGVLIGDVTEDSPAAKAGVREGDIVLRVNGAKVETPADMQKAVREAGAGGVLALGVWRDGAEKQLTATAGERLSSADEAPRAMVHRDPRGTGKVKGAVPPRIEMFPGGEAKSPGGFLGVQLADLTPQLRTYFGVSADEGVLIAEVEQGSPAAAAGLRAGDVLTKVGDESVSSQAAARGEIRDHKPGSSVALTVIRDKAPRTLSATLDKAPVSEVSIGDIQGLEGLEGLRGLEGLKALEGLKGLEGFTSPEGDQRIRIKRMAPGDAPQVFEWHGDRDDDAEFDAPRVYRLDGKQGDSHRIIIRDKRDGDDDAEDGEEIWGDDGNHGDKHMRIIVKKHHGTSREARGDRELRREIRDLQRQIEELRDEIGDGDDDR